MKKLIAILLLCCMLPFGALAEETADNRLSELSADGLCIRLALPEGMTVHGSEQEAGVTLAEPAEADIVGCLADPEGVWYILWQLDENVDGDMDQLLNGGGKSLYQLQGKNRRYLGCIAALNSEIPEERQWYIRMAYEFTDQSARPWYAESYYTKQYGRGISVTLCSAVPLTGSEQAMLESIVSGQLITADE